MVFPEIQADIDFVNILATDPSTKWRVMLYGIDPAFNMTDFTNPYNVITYGELINGYWPDDPNTYSSNCRIAQNGIKITDYYNKDVDYQIGQSTSSEIEIDFINDDGFMTAGGTYPQHFVWSWTYALQAWMWNADYNDWTVIPMGLWWFEKPEQTTGLIVHAKGHDAMSRIEGISASGLFDNVTFSSSNRVKLKEIYELLETFVSAKFEEQQQEYIGVFAGMPVWFDKNNYSKWANANYEYIAQPFDPAKYNCRQVLEMIAGVAAGNAFVSRNGQVRIRGFEDAKWGSDPTYYTLDGDAAPTDIIELTKAEYTVPQIDKLTVMYGQLNTIRRVGSGQNELRVVNNDMYNLLSAGTMLQAVYDKVSAIPSYTPMTLRTFIMPCIESGDVIRVVRGGVTYSVPVFQQTLQWKGGPFMSEIVCSGNEFRQIDDEQTGEYYTAAETAENKAQIVELQDAIDTLGTIVTDSPSAYISVPTGSWTEIASITLDAGTYIIIGFAQFLHSSSGTGTTRRIVVSNASGSSTAAGRGLISTGVPPSGVASDETCATFFEVGQQQTYYLNAYHDAGVNIAVYPKLSAMRIK